MWGALWLGSPLPTRLQLNAPLRVTAAGTGGGGQGEGRGAGAGARYGEVS